MVCLFGARKCPLSSAAVLCCTEPRVPLSHCRTHSLLAFAVDYWTILMRAAVCIVASYPRLTQYGENGKLNEHRAGYLPARPASINIVHAIEGQHEDKYEKPDGSTQSGQRTENAARAATVRRREQPVQTTERTNEWNGMNGCM